MNYYYNNLESDDEKYTKKYGVEILLPYIEHLKNKIIWCPFDKKESMFVKVLKENNFKVIYSHIDYKQDFLNYEPEKWDIIISNPPFKEKRKFIERCVSLGKPFCLLLSVNILNDGIVNDIFTNNNLQLQLLIPYQKMKFNNSEDKKINFKACYFANKVFKKDIILLKKRRYEKGVICYEFKRNI